MAAMVLTCGRGLLLSQTNILSPGDPILASSSSFPISESATNAIDGTDAKYVNFDSANDSKRSGFVVTPSAGSTIVTGIAMESANDAPDRDPKQITIEGSNDDAISSFDSGTWSMIVQIDVPSWETVFGPLANRYQVQTLTFPNTTSYKHYRWTVLHTQGPSTCCMQISEVQLLGSTALLPMNQPPTVSTPIDVVDMDWNSSIDIPYTISDPDSILDVTNIAVQSSLPTLVPNSPANLVVTGGPFEAGTSGTVNLRVTPAPESAGSESLTFALTDGSNYVTNTLTLRVHSPDWPAPSLTILSQPASIFVQTGGDASFTVTADGVRPISYQWEFLGTNLLGATNAFLNLTNVQPSQAGAYSVIVSNATGIVTSALAILSIAATGGLGVIAGPITNPANGHAYFLLEPAAWTNAELAAVAMGGHLVTLNTPDEQTWVYNTFANFGGISQDLWIGLYDPDPSVKLLNPIQQLAKYAWTSGQPVPLTGDRWAEGGPFNYDHVSSGFFKLCGPGTLNPTDQGRWADAQPQVLLSSVVELPLDLEIVAQPQPITVGIGCDATVPVFADGRTALSYQWQLAGTNLPGQTLSKLVLTNVQFADSGSYSVVVSNAGGTTNTIPARVSVVAIVTWGSGPGGGDSRGNVPPDLTNAVAIAAGYFHDLALKPDGTVLAWGQNAFNQTDVPAGLTNVVAIAGGSGHSLALKRDGTVVAWGINYGTTTQVPPDLTNVVAIDAGAHNSLALKADSTVVAWGEAYGGKSIAPDGLTNVVAISAGAGHDLALLANGTVVDWNDTTGALNSTPVDLTNAIAISAGELTSLALKADGTVVGWGTAIDYGGSLKIPPGLSNVVGLSIKWDHSLAMTTDGTLVAAWGTNFSGESSVPARLPNVVAIAGGFYHSLALLRDGAPSMMVQPWDRSVSPGSSPCFAAKAVSRESMSYQWQFNGSNIVGATQDNLSVPNAQPSAAGLYTLSVSNQIGIVTSRQAKLVVSSVAPATTNHPPVLPAQPNWAIYELTPLVVVNTATDPDNSNLPLTYQLINPPAGATIDSTGIIRWTPTEAQGPSTVLITTVVTKGGDVPLSATNSFTVAVNEANSPPVLPAQTDLTISALSPLTVVNTATDPDIPANTLSYQLLNPPAGATIDSSGIIRWTPARTQGPGTNTLITVVTDNGVPSLSATNRFTVIVGAPTLAAIQDLTINPGRLLSMTNAATDNDPARHLSFGLDAAPKGATISSDSGVFSWRPPMESAGSSNYVQVRVKDDSAITLSDVRGFNILVNPLEPAVLQLLSVTNGTRVLRVNGAVGPDYLLQTSADLRQWLNLQTSSPALMPVDFVDTNMTSSTNRFYRVRLGP